MKKYLRTISFLILFILCGWGLAQLIPQLPPISGKQELATYTSSSDSVELMLLLEKIQGSWVDQGYVTGFQDGALMYEPEPDFLLDIRPENRRGNGIAIYVSEYCRPEEADYLIFEYIKGRLVFVGAEWDACFLDIPRIDFMVLGYDATNDRIRYEARETEYQHHVQLELARRPALANGWHCHMQYHVIDILTQGSYTLLGPDYHILSVAEAFGQEDLLDDLFFFEQFSSLWPMFEEICVRAPFEVVVLGGLSPGSVQKVYAIEWNSAEIRLYDTFAGTDSEDGVFPLEKGSLRVIIVPEVRAVVPEVN